ncbi:MAG: hypothetical protein PWP45_200 [Tepidanaerobacteraceae bacterium]|nr:hypothetical protein [Tepidanaerobacteraceae bacterium]
MVALLVFTAIIAVIVVCFFFFIRLHTKIHAEINETEDKTEKAFSFVQREDDEKDDEKIVATDALELDTLEICQKNDESNFDHGAEIPEEKELENLESPMKDKGETLEVFEREGEVKGEDNEESEEESFQEQIENGEAQDSTLFFEKKLKGEDVMDPLIQVPVLVGEGSIQKMVESTVTLEKPAIKVREIRAQVDDLNTEIIQDKVIIQGMLHKQIFYVGTDAVIHHQTEIIPVNYFIDIPGAAPGMNVTVTPTIEHVTYTLLDQNTLHQKVILVFNAVVSDPQSIEVLPGVGTPLYYVPQVVGQGSQQLIVETTVQLSNPAQKVDEIKATVRDIITDVITDKVVIQGVLHKQIFYVGTDNVEYHQAEDVPFSLFVDVTGAAPGMNVQVQPVIESINYTLENENTLQQKVVIQFSITVTENTKLNLTPISGKTILVEEIIGETTGQTLLQNTITMERPAQKIRNIDATVTNISCQVITNKIIIQGTIHKQIFYISTDNIEYEQGEDMNFSFFVNLTGVAPGMNCNLVPTIESIIPELLSDTQLLQKVVLKVDILVTSTVRLQEVIPPI